MHIPDGLMEPTILAFGWIIAILMIGISTRRVNKNVDMRFIPLMSILAAGIFVAQMLNFPVGGGTTGHLVGATLAAIFLGPYVGIIIMTVILIIQCLLFGDGGITALGLNVFNMGIIGCLVGWNIYKIFPKKYKIPGIFISSWLAVFVGAIACSLELSISFSMSGGEYGIKDTISIPTMLGFHAIIGIGEAIITTGVIKYVSQVSPEMLKMPKILLRTIKEEVSVNV